MSRILCKLRCELLTELSAAHEVVNMITNKAKGWEVLNNAENVETLQTATATLQSAMTEFDQTMLVKSMGDMKKKYGKEFLTVACDNFLKLKTPLKTMKDERERLVRMQEASGAKK